MPAGTTPSILISTFIGWAFSKLFWYLISKTYKLSPRSLLSLGDLKSLSDIYGWSIPSFVRAMKASLICPYLWL